MQKLDNKGFMVAGVIYSILLLFVIVFSALITLLANRKNVLDSTNNEIKEEINNSDQSGLGGVDNSGGGSPVLSSNMVGITLTEQGKVIVADTSNSKWYNYSSGIWANAVVLKAGVTAPEPGNVIPMENINQMYVWIPRFKYKLFNPAGEEVEKQRIEIEFESKTTMPSTGDYTDEWLTHPAFRLGGNEEISGFWIGKFEISDGNKMIPNVNSIGKKSIGYFYNQIKTLNPAGTDNVHVMKNTEWGATAYLSQSKYGICKDLVCSNKIASNNIHEERTYNITTGCSNGPSGKAVAGGICPEDGRWYTLKGKKATTTQNIYGVYDMVGGRAEYVMGAMKDSTNTNVLVLTSEFNQTILNGLSPKFLNVYNYGTLPTDNTRSLLGDATIETKIWSSGKKDFVKTDSGWFMRGGRANGSESSIWDYDANGGRPYPGNSTRAAIFGY